MFDIIDVMSGSFGSFAELVEECVGVPAAVLDERLRANEVELRRLLAERAVLVGVVERRGVFAAEHRSMAGYLRDDGELLGLGGVA